MPTGRSSNEKGFLVSETSWKSLWELVLQMKKKLDGAKGFLLNNKDSLVAHAPTNAPLEAVSSDQVFAKVSAAATKGAVYSGYLLKAPTAILTLNPTASGTISEANIAGTGANIWIVNLAELTKNTHDLTNTTRYRLGVYPCWPAKMIAPYDNKPFYFIDGVDEQGC